MGKKSSMDAAEGLEIYYKAIQMAETERAMRTVVQEQRRIYL